MRATNMAILVITIICGAGLGAQSSTWVKAGEDSLARTDGAFAQFNNRIWSLGGRAPDAGAPSTANGMLTNSIWSSPDGISWQMDSNWAPWSAREGHTGVEFNGRLWVIGGEADVWSSADGLTWIMECGNPGWGKRQGHTTVVMNNRIWLIGGYQNGTPMNDVWSTSDGVNWTLETGAAPWAARKRHSSVVFNSRIWVLGGINATAALNDVWSSPDGISWTPETGAANWSARDGHATCVLNGRIYLLGGTLDFGTSSNTIPSADVWSSTDGINWSAETFAAPWSARTGASCMVLNNELWIIGGADGADAAGFIDSWSSPDGNSWTSKGPRIGLAPGRLGEARCVFKGRLWMIGGGTTGTQVFGDVWSSPDGINWTQETASAPFGARTNHAVEVLNGRMYLMGGEQKLQLLSDVWSSADGVNWTLESTQNWPAYPGYAASAGRTAHVTTVFNGRIYLMGGLSLAWTYSTDVWSTADGVNWTLEGSGFPSADYLKVETFNNQMWAFGGTSTMADPGRREIWSSPDGVTWTRQTATAPWGTRSKHATAVWGGRMWLFGGQVITTHGGWKPGLQNDTWSTSDGVTWLQESPTSAFQKARGYASGDVLNGQLWMHGGWDGNNTYFYRSQDCWQYIDNGAAPQFTSTPSTTLVVGNSFSYTPTFSGTPAPRLSVSGSPPAWLQIDTTTGTLSGTPTASDIGTSRSITLEVSNVFGSDSQSFQIVVLGPAPVITSSPIATATAGIAYTYAVTAIGGPPAPTLSAAGLPAWLSFDPVTGLLTGTPTVADIGRTSPITITASNGTPPDAQQTFAIDVVGSAPVLSLQGNSVTAVTGKPFSYTIIATGTPAPTLTVGTLPAWLTFDSVTGTLSGVPVDGVSGTIVDISADNGWGTATAQLEIKVVDSWSAKASPAGGCAAESGATSGLWAALLAMTGLALSRRKRKA